MTRDSLAALDEALAGTLPEPVTSLTVTIPGRPPTPNSRRHWRVTHRDNRRWKDEAWIRSLVALADESGFPLDRGTCVVEFVVPDKRRRDLDNLIASTKPLMDGIVAAGVIRDDSADVLVSVTYSVRYAKGMSATVFRFEAAA